MIDPLRKERLYIRAYTEGPYGDKFYGYIIEIWGEQVWFQLDGESQAWPIHKKKVFELDVD